MKQQTGKAQKLLKQKGPKTLKDRVRQHLSNKNDVITDEDLKNVPVGEDAFNAETEQGREFSADIEKAGKLADTIEEKKATSPWVILSEEDK